LATKSASLLAACDLSNKTGAGCAWCGAELPKRRRTWCSDRCADTFWKNHWWSLARTAAKRRDKYACKRCGHKPPKRTDPHFRKRRKTERLEVNHIVQARGAHRALSCLHHLGNLETLCVNCHKAETKTQASARGKASSRGTARALLV
jgi:5-methylcytosine-specific restriction endonuclease McrA